MSGTIAEGGGWRLTRAELAAWLEALLREGRELVAPVERDGLRTFRGVAGPTEIAPRAGKTDWSPKERLFPRSETLFRWRGTAEAVQLEDAPREDREQVLFGVAPCDAAGLARLDAVLGADPGFASRRARTTVIARACTEAAPECFCTALGGAPDGEEGSDLLLEEDGEDWLLRPLSAKGLELAASARAAWTAASADDRERARARARRVAEHVRSGEVARSWAARLEQSFAAPVWSDVARRCVGCSICTYVCPSCSCFDVNDVGGSDCGSRCRSWDSCTFGPFTRHATGHNPRPTQASRYRQRVLHKFSYFPLEHDGRSMCVGCGRCVKLCPVGLDVLQAVTTVIAATEEQR